MQSQIGNEAQIGDIFLPRRRESMVGYRYRQDADMRMYIVVDQTDRVARLEICTRYIHVHGIRVLYTAKGILHVDICIVLQIGKGNTYLGTSAYIHHQPPTTNAKPCVADEREGG